MWRTWAMENLLVTERDLDVAGLAPWLAGESRRSRSQGLEQHHRLLSMAQ